MAYDRLSYEQPTYSSYSREDLKDEIERLKAEVTQLESNVTYWFELSEKGNYAMQENCVLRTRVEELTHRHEQQVERSESLRKERDGFMFVCGDLRAARNEALAERDDYKQRVEELEAKLEDCLTMSMNMEGLFNDVHEERDALRLKLDAFQDTKAYVSKLIEDNVALRAELEQTKQEKNMPGYLSWDNKQTQLEAENARLKNNIEGLNYIIGNLEAELDEVRNETHVERKVVAKLQAELAALKPVPVVKVLYYYRYATDWFSKGVEVPDGDSNLKLTFTDGKLTGATIIGDEE